MTTHSLCVPRTRSGHLLRSGVWSVLIALAVILVTPRSPILAAEPSAKLTAVHGTVALVRADGSAVQPVSPQTVLGPGDRLATVGGASATFEIAGVGQIELGADTTIIVRELGADGIVIEVVRGMTVHRLTGTVPYRVIDPSGEGTAEARGPATFGVARDENGNLTVACATCSNESLTFPTGKSTVTTGWALTLTSRGDLVSEKLGGNLFNALAQGASADDGGSKTSDGNRVPAGQRTGSKDTRPDSDDDEDDKPVTGTQAQTIIRVLPTIQATIASFVFLPDPIVVEAGQSIRWTNLDRADHTVTANDHAFTSAVMNQGDTYTLTLMQPGTYAYFCEPHPQMTATIIVQ